MKTSEAIKILREMNKWRRGEHPYDGDEPKDMPYPPHVFGEAIDALCDEYETLHMTYLSQVGMYKAMAGQSPSDETIMRILNAVGYEDTKWIDFVRKRLEKRK